MGKRELLIISLFAVAGVVAYRLTLPPSTESRSRLTWTSLRDAFRPDARRNRATAANSSRGSIEVPNGTGEVRISGISGLTVMGGTRPDIEYELTIDASAPDEPTARDAAARAVLQQDRVGSVLALRVDQQARGARLSARLKLAIPAGLAVRAEGAPGTGRLLVTDVASLRLESVMGDVTATGITGDITGSHRNGDLTITKAGAAHLSLVSSTTTITGVAGDVSINARNGRLQIRAARGTVELELTNQQTTIDAPPGPVHVLGAAGALQIKMPEAPVTVDVRRMAVDVSLSRPIPIAVLTTDAPVHLSLVNSPAVTLDAIATDGGRIRAIDLPIVPASSGTEVRAHHTFGAGEVTVALRNQRADIVIDAVK